MNFFDLMGEKHEEKFEKAPKVIAPSTHEARLLKEKELLGFFLTGHPMDKYKEIMVRLSCVPFSKVDELPHDSVVRTAFIIETVQIRFSSKSQKKFAILMVSDGFQSHELPIWPEMFEEKSTLLRENQLIYAILHVDRKEEALKLGAKWLHDLTLADENMIQESDLAFDKAKSQIQRFNQAKAQQKDRPEKPKAEAKVEKMEPVKIELDVAKVRLSHILRFKEMFEANRGATPVDLVFLSGKEVKAVITLDGKWGVNFNDDLKAKIKKFDSCRRID